jgi:hypothetical protein
MNKSKVKTKGNTNNNAGSVGGPPGSGSVMGSASKKKL